MEGRDERTVDRIRPVSTEEQDLTAQRDALATLGVAPERVYLDHGLTGTNRDRPACARLWPPAGTGTPSWSPSSTGSPGPCPTPEPSPMNSPSGTSSSASAVPCTT